MFWLDGLDIPLVQFLDASFVGAASNEDEQPIGKPAGDSFARYGANLLPVDQNAHGQRPRRSSTIPMTARARRCIGSRRATNAIPATASRCATPIPSPAITPCRPWAPSSSCCRRASRPARYRSTDATVFVAMEGNGRTRIGDQVVRMGAAGHLRGAELEVGHARGRRGEACCSASPTARCRRRSVCARGSRQRVRFCNKL